MEGKDKVKLMQRENTREAERLYGSARLRPSEVSSLYLDAGG